jgi:hypothetical protein
MEYIAVVLLYEAVRLPVAWLVHKAFSKAKKEN